MIIGIRNMFEIYYNWRQIDQQVENIRIMNK